MAIEADGYYWIYSRFTAGTKKKDPGTYTTLTAATGDWTGPSSGSASLGTKSASHAERVAYAAMKTGMNQSKAFYLFVQNGFPCGDCLTFYKAEPADNFFIFVVTADQGSYSMDNGFTGFQIDYPQIMYINAGQVWYPGYVTFWTHARDAQNQRISTKEARLRSINEAGIFGANGRVKKPRDWQDFPSIQDYT